MLPKSDTEACSRLWERRVAQARWEPGYQEEQGAEALAESLAVSREAPVVECGRWVAGWPGTKCAAGQTMCTCTKPL